MPIFTDKHVRNVKVPDPTPDGRTVQLDLWDAGLPGFGLRLSSSGKKSWVVAVRLPGSKNPTRVVLGSYPAMSLAEAREKAREAKVAASQNKDPREAQKKEKAAQEEAEQNTFGVLVKEFFEKHVGRKGLRASTARDYRHVLEGADVAAWNKRPIASITKAEVLSTLDRIIARGSPIAGNHFLQYTRTFFNFCVERGVIVAAPTDRLRLPVPVRARERALSADEVAELWAALDEYGATDEPRQRSDIFAAIFRLLLLTGQRREEVAGMRWAELRDLGSPDAVWELGSARTKNHRPHLVPLSQPAVEIIKGIARLADSPFVFTTSGSTSVSGFSKAKERLDAVIAKRREKTGIAVPMPAWVVHDLRRTVSTRMHEDLGIAPHIVEAVLNHVSGHRAGVAGTYNRALYLEEKRRALDLWSHHVLTLIKPTPNPQEQTL